MVKTQYKGYGHLSKSWQSLQRTYKMKYPLVN